jgi:hypothetical protein
MTPFSRFHSTTMQTVLSPDRVVVTVIPWSPLLSAQAEALLCCVAVASATADPSASMDQDCSLRGAVVLAPANVTDARMVMKLRERAVALLSG